MCGALCDLLAAPILKPSAWGGCMLCFTPCVPQMCPANQIGVLDIPLKQLYGGRKVLAV